MVKDAELPAARMEAEQEDRDVPGASTPVDVVKDRDVPAASMHAEVEEHRLEERILSAVEFHNSKPAADKRRVTYNHFTLDVTDVPSTALTMMRNLEDVGLATLLKYSDTHETFALPIPMAPTALRTASEQWWVGLSPAETRAGPIREHVDVLQAEREIQNKAVRQKKSNESRGGRLNMEKQNMRESLRRQILHLPMEGPISRAVEELAWKEHGDEWEEMLGELSEEEDEEDEELSVIDEDEEMVEPEDDDDSSASEYREGK